MKLQLKKSDFLSSYNHMQAYGVFRYFPKNKTDVITWLNKHNCLDTNHISEIMTYCKPVQTE